MPLLNIIQLDANLLLLKNTPLLNPDEKIQKLVQALEGVNPPVKLVLGTHYQDKNAIQITLEHRKNCQSITNPLLELGVRTSCVATASAVEFVLSYFPTSSINPEFQKKIEDDFIRFDEIYSPAATGDQGLVYGWLEGEQSYEDVDGGSAKCFFVMRGWNSMTNFEASIKTEAYKEAIPLLFGWKAPFKMWYVERQS